MKKYERLQKLKKGYKTQRKMAKDRDIFTMIRLSLMPLLYKMVYEGLPIKR